jgi:hypothetical protein
MMLPSRSGAVANIAQGGMVSGKVMSEFLGQRAKRDIVTSRQWENKWPIDQSIFLIQIWRQAWSGLKYGMCIRAAKAK